MMTVSAHGRYSIVGTRHKIVSDMAVFSNIIKVMDASIIKHSKLILNFFFDILA